MCRNVTVHIQVQNMWTSTETWHVAKYWAQTDISIELSAELEMDLQTRWGNTRWLSFVWSSLKRIEKLQSRRRCKLQRAEIAPDHLHKWCWQESLYGWFCRISCLLLAARSAPATPHPPWWPQICSSALPSALTLQLAAVRMRTQFNAYWLRPSRHDNNDWTAPADDWLHDWTAENELFS